MTATQSVDDSPSGAAPQEAPLSPAKPPVGNGVIGLLGPILAVLALAAGVVLVRDSLVWFGRISGPAWTSRVAWGLNGMTPQAWLIPLGIAAVLLGLWLLLVALRPRPRTGVALAAETGVFLRPADVARLARARAEEVDGVLGATSSATRRTLNVTVTATTDVTDEVKQAVTQRIGALQSPPKVRVRLKTVTS